MNKKIVALVLVCVLIFSTVVAGTLAFLMDTTSTVTNTFTFGNVDIKLTEGGSDITTDTSKEFTLVPGSYTDKDPAVTVEGGSERSWVFVKVDKANDLDYFVDVVMADGWTELETGVYYKDVAKSDDDQKFAILANDKVYCKNDVTKARIDAVIDGTADAPSLAFTAYAVQYDAEDVDTAAKAWNIAKAA